ncbi:hypothetical protein TARUN_7846 [Trichoderma arundinaceum]|uniref:Uncharacterized protein n=1 Tax=Trichoderma arundinaceum TaxID=490622 RepID=A0A395NE92_TRIAR|nr:hypothetical protein TARUN_7846 [Trichoderma arundinaceum]
MDESAERGSLIQAEEPEQTIPITHQGFDEPERRISNQYTGRNRHAGEVDSRLPVCEANPQTQSRVPDLVSDITPPLPHSDRSMAREASLEALGATSAILLEEEPRCMFVDDCQTGSQLRKAISHLFGRNKACTLRIPKHVWVYYCRKHYQRIRYRNAKTYPLNQMHLVTMQINRLQKWSDENQRQGLGPYIKLWTLTLRKREQNRLDKEGGAIDEGDEDSPETQYGSAAPEWIIERLGTGYTTEQMLEVAERLYREIEDGTLSQVPEVEFLPDIIESEARSIVKLVRSRKQARTAVKVGEIKAPKRKVSEAADSLHERNSSLSHQHGTDEAESPSRKRVHLSPPPSIGQQQPHQMPLPSIMMPAYASSHVPMPPTDAQSAIPRSLPVIPRMRVSSASHPQDSDAHLHALSSSEFQRPSPFNGTHSYEPQQCSTHYHLGIDSAHQPPPFPRDRDHQSYQRLPSISAHLSAASDFNNPNFTIPSYRTSGAFGDNLNVPRPPHLRSYSDNLPTAQPPLEYPRPASSSGAVQSGLICFDDRAMSTSAHQLNNRGCSREQWPEPDHSYAASRSRSSALQQQNYCPSRAVYDQDARPQMDNSPQASAYFGLAPSPAHGPLLGPVPTFLGPTKLGAASGRVEYEAQRYGNTWPHADQVVTRATREVREE